MTGPRLASGHFTFFWLPVLKKGPLLSQPTPTASQCLSRLQCLKGNPRRGHRLREESNPCSDLERF